MKTEINMPGHGEMPTVAGKMMEGWNEKISPKTEFKDSLYIFSENGGFVSAEDIFSFYKNSINEAKHEAEENEAHQLIGRDGKVINKIKKGEEMLASGDTNNFPLFFMKAEFDKYTNRSTCYYGMKPSFINEAYNGLWSEMCRRYPAQVSLAIEFANQYHGRRKPDEAEKKAFAELANFLVENGVDAFFIFN